MPRAKKKSKQEVFDDKYKHLHPKERSIRELEDILAEDLMKFVEPVIRKRLNLFSKEIVKLLKERGDIPE